ncbi:F-box domain, Leucine-rich repeat domain, L domain-like protein [Artemisia annua]|uniref:F-box domain, Leucine-rich repeat domain, L domain-like protein n=1 Tax=Artemisia annua TaxID=35608 RepID=A0A2U1NCS5_ARTAN|nr:F-box domain, Leucine-rich repeat domain, L domain-like protein [Artemisia annua]
MKKINKPDESADSSSFSCLPDDILLQILSRLIDLKTLCRCKLVSNRFNNTVQQVNTISVTITSVDHPSFDSNSSGASSERDRPVNLLFKCESFVSVMKSLQTFSALKSLCIEIPPFHTAPDNRILFKWKFKLGRRTDSFLFLSPNSVCDLKENVQDEEENVMLTQMKRLVATSCLVDGLTIRIEMRHYMKCFPLLENVTITDTGKRGRLSLCGEEIVTETIEQTPKSFRSNERTRWCYVPLLKLPVSGYMMKGVFLAQFEVSDLPCDDSFADMNLNGFEDKVCIQ